MATLPYIPNDNLALKFGGSRSLNEITLDQVRRFADSAGLPMKPAWEIVRETIEQTAEAWKALNHKDLLPPETLTVVDQQISEDCGRNEHVARLITKPSSRFAIGPVSPTVRLLLGEAAGQLFNR